MGNVVERKEEKKGPQQKRTHNSAPHSASNYRAVTVPVPLRRSTRRNPNPDADEIQFPSVPVPASGPAPLRRSTRRKPNPDAGEIRLPSVPVPAFVPAPLRRSTRRKPNPDADEIRLPSGPAPLRGSTRRKYKRLRKIGEMTDEERYRYREQVFKSDGFDVDPMPDVRTFGLIRPVDLRNKEMYSRCEKFSRHAIEEYEPLLEFVKVLKAMSKPCGIRRYYITFEAKDVADEGKHKIYQALVRCRAPLLDGNFELILVREYKHEKGDEVIGIHSASELETQLNAASTTSRLVILFFYAVDPGGFTPLLYKNLASKFPEVVFLKINIEEDEASDVNALWNVDIVPCYFFLKNGKEVVDKVVKVDPNALKSMIEQHTGKQAKFDENMNSSTVSCSKLKVQASKSTTCLHF